MIIVERIADRATLKGAVRQQITCQQTGRVLDVGKAVLAELTMQSGNVVSVVVTADVWPATRDALVNGLGAHLTSIKVYDGRELFGSRRK